MSTKEKKIVSLAAEKLNVLYRDTLDTITKARYLDKLKIETKMRKGKYASKIKTVII